MGEPAATARPTGVAAQMAGHARFFAAAVFICAAFTLLAPAAHATPPGVNGVIVEPEMTSGTACHFVQRQPDGSHPTELLSTCPDLSIDGGGMTAETDFDGTSGIEIRVGGVLQRTITVADRPTGYGYAYVALSPDGAWVAFELLPIIGSHAASLYVAPTDGSSAPRELISYVPDSGNGAIAYYPTWTPDSKRLVTFLKLSTPEYDGYEELVSIDVSSGTAASLATASDIAPTDHNDWTATVDTFTVDDVSPDGTRALIDAGRLSGFGTENRLFEVTLGSSSATRVSNSEYDLPQSLVAAAVYSPDGTELAIHVLDESSATPFNGEYLVLHRLHDTNPADDHTISVLSTSAYVSLGNMVWQPVDSVSIDSPAADTIVDADAAEHAGAGDSAGVVKATITGSDFDSWCYTVGPVSPPPASICKTPLTGASPHHVTIPYKDIADRLKQGPNTITVYGVTNSGQVISATRTFQWHLPPIIFVPGFGGSEIDCATGHVLFPQLTGGYWIDFKHMRLADDGFSPYPDGDSCTRTATATGLVRSVNLGPLSIDIYGAGEDWLKGLSDPANGRPEYTYYYDWRKSPSVNADGLNQTVDDARAAAHVGKVVLVAHSMGGLVIRAFLASPDHAAKVTRAITLGTPYWGAPKSIFPIEEGHEVPDIGAYQIDPFAKNGEFQLFAATSSGLDSLLPSDNFPWPWLGVEGSDGHSVSWIRQAQLGAFLQTNFGASGSLINAARALHAQIDGFPATAVDYRAVVSGGTLTIDTVILTKGIFGWSASTLTGDGDGTVPLSSQKQQADTFIHSVLGAQVPIYVQCGVGHMAETEDPGIQARLQAWISDGKPIPAGDSGGCTASGDELNIPADPSSAGAAHDATAALATQVPGALTLEQAQVRGLVQVLTFPDHQIVLTDSQRPVDLALPPGVHDLTVTPLLDSKRGAAQRYSSSAAISSVLVSGATVRPSAGGTALHPVHGVLATPRTVAIVRIRGSHAVVNVRATGGTPYVRLGSRAARPWRSAITLPGSQLRTVAFAAVNGFGTAEPEHFIRATSAIRSRNGITVTVVCNRAETGPCIGTLGEGRARVAYSVAPGHTRLVTLRKGRGGTISVFDHTTLIEQLITH